MCGAMMVCGLAAKHTRFLPTQRIKTQGGVLVHDVVQPWNPGCSGILLTSRSCVSAGPAPPGNCHHPGGPRGERHRGVPGAVLLAHDQRSKPALQPGQQAWAWCAMLTQENVPLLRMIGHRVRMLQPTMRQRSSDQRSDSIVLPCCQARLLLLAALSGEHILFIGPPGTAKSELGRRLSQLYKGNFFERLLTRFSVPEVSIVLDGRASEATCGHLNFLWSLLQLAIAQKHPYLIKHACSHLWRIIRRQNLIVELRALTDICEARFHLC